MCHNDTEEEVGQPPYSSYAQVAQLREPALHELSQSGDEPERVWATWALALIDPLNAASLALEYLGAEPSPGVRRNLVVMVASKVGDGVISSLELLASADPDADVRQTACLYHARVSQHTDQPNAFLDQRLLQESAPSITLSILRVAAEQRRPISERSLTHVLLNVEWSVRDVAMSYLEGFGERVCPALIAKEELLRLATEELDPQLSARLCRICLRSIGPESLLKVAGLREHGGEISLQVLGEAGVRFSWPELAAVALPAKPKLSSYIIPLMSNTDTVEPIQWLIESVSAHETARAINCSEEDMCADPDLVKRTLYRCLAAGVTPCPTPATDIIIESLQSELRETLAAAELEDPGWDVESHAELLRDSIQALKPWSAANMS